MNNAPVNQPTTGSSPGAIGTLVAQRLNFPVNYFGIALGTLALALTWRYAAGTGMVPGWGAQFLAIVGVATWLLLIVSYGLRWLHLADAALTEFRDHIACCFISLIPVTTLQVALVIRPYFGAFGHYLAIILAVVGTVSQVLFAIYRTPDLWRGKHSLGATTPVVYLPAVATNFSTSAVFGQMGHSDYGLLFFGAGVLSWFSLEAAILGRLRTESALPAASRGIIGIQLAPPLVGAAAWLSLNGGQVDVFVLGLTGYGLLLFLYFVRLIPWLLEAGFTKSLWGFSFGLAAMANVGAHLVQNVRVPEGTLAGVSGNMPVLGTAMFWVGTGAIIALWVAHLWSLKRPAK